MSSNTVYLAMSNPSYSKIETRVRESYPYACICWIEEVINQPLLDAYNTYKGTFSTPNEHHLFHGTYEGIVNTIAKEGKITVV